MTLTNRSAVPCHLFGYPGVALIDGTGKVLPLTYRRGGDQEVTSAAPVNVNLMPNHSAFVTINKYRCDSGDLDIATTVSVIPPDQTQALTLSVQGVQTLAYCGPGDPGSIVSVSPVEATEIATMPS